MVSPSTSGDVTGLLQAWRGGDENAVSELIPIVYDELRRIAVQQLAREHIGHTLQPTALVHELFMRLFPNSEVSWQDRSHFFAIAAKNMRQILVDHARCSKRLKRGGGIPKISLDEACTVATERPSDLLRLDDALRELESFDALKSSIVELRFYGGLTIEEAAEVTGASTATVSRQWRAARAWLARELTQQAADSEG